MKNTLGKTIKRLRENHPKYGKISQNEFARKELKMEVSWLSQIENDKFLPGDAVLKKIADKLGVNFLLLIILKYKEHAKTLDESSQRKVKFLINRIESSIIHQDRKKKLQES